MNVDEFTKIKCLSRVAVEAPHALSLALQLFDMAACQDCRYIKKHCRCIPIENKRIDNEIPKT